jgi:hypothetical protein
MRSITWMVGVVALAEEDCFPDMEGQFCMTEARLRGTGPKLQIAFAARTAARTEPSSVAG